MRYKAMAKKLRQLVELDDPIPAEAVLANEEDLQNIGADENTNENTDNYTNENTDKCTIECTNENTGKRSAEHINEYTNDCTDKCTNENTNKHTNDCIVESTNTSSNSLQNTDSNSTDNKNAITMRNKFALVGNDVLKSIELSSRNIDLSKEGAKEGGKYCDVSHKGMNSGDLSVDNFVNNRLTIEDRKRRIYQLLHAIAIYKEVVDGVNGVTQLMARVDAFLDPERIEEATTLAMWREKYKNEIIFQNKFKWWKK